MLQQQPVLSRQRLSAIAKMVEFHSSVRSYRQPSETEATAHEEQLKHALDAAKRLILCGLHATQPGNIYTYAAIFQRYFPNLSPTTVQDVHNKFKGMRKMVKHDKEVGLVFHVGTAHLSGPAEIYIPRLKRRLACNIDLTKSLSESFDERGRYKGTSTLLHCVNRRWDQPTASQAFTDLVRNRHLGLVRGRDIYFSPFRVRMEDSLRPYIGDYQITEDEGFWHLKALPATMFHELSHSLLLGDDSLDDPRVVPATILNYMESPNTFHHTEASEPNPKRKPHKESCVYGDHFCSLLAKDPHVGSLALTNADSYTMFALSVYMWNLG